MSSVALSYIWKVFHEKMLKNIKIKNMVLSLRFLYFKQLLHTSNPKLIDDYSYNPNPPKKSIATQTLQDLPRTFVDNKHGVDEETDLANTVT